MIVEHGILEAARQRHVLLRDSLRERIDLLEIDDDWKAVEATRPWERKYLWRKRLNRFPPVREDELSQIVREIVATRPDATDVVASRNEQTLRYPGFPFARVRRVMDP